MGVFHLFKILQSVLNRVKQSVGSRCYICLFLSMLHFGCYIIFWNKNLFKGYIARLYLDFILHTQNFLIT